MKVTILLLGYSLLWRNTWAGAANGYYCQQVTKNSNFHLKCTETPCKKNICETIIDYVDDHIVPDVILDHHNNQISMDLEIENTSTIHVSSSYRVQGVEAFSVVL